MNRTDPLQIALLWAIAGLAAGAAIAAVVVWVIQTGYGGG